MNCTNLYCTKRIYIYINIFLWTFSFKQKLKFLKRQSLVVICDRHRFRFLLGQGWGLFTDLPMNKLTLRYFMMSCPFFAGLTLDVRRFLARPQWFNYRPHNFKIISLFWYVMALPLWMSQIVTLKIKSYHFRGLSQNHCFGHFAKTRIWKCWVSVGSKRDIRNPLGCNLTNARLFTPKMLGYLNLLLGQGFFWVNLIQQLGLSLFDWNNPAERWNQ